MAAGELTIGSFTAFTQYVAYFEDGFSNAANLWLQIRSTLVAAGRFVTLLERKPSVASKDGALRPPACKGHLRICGVDFTYPQARGAPVLRDFELDAPPGSMVALCGASGAGKSTVARLIERFYDPHLGSLTLDGIDFRDLDLRWLRRQIGFVEQEPTLFDRSVLENLRYGVERASDEEVLHAARLANADEFIRELPRGYRTKPGERGTRISGGQKQRLAIARAVLKSPALLLLDEATSALDSSNEASVQAALDRMMRDRTTVVIAHRLSTVVRASQIIVMHKGVALERGTHDDLAGRPGSRYAEFMKHQLVEPRKSKCQRGGGVR